MEAKETIDSLFSIINELREREQFENKDFFELFNLSIKILDLSLKDESQLAIHELSDINSSLNDICNTLYEIDRTLISNQ